MKSAEDQIGRIQQHHKERIASRRTNKKRLCIGSAIVIVIGWLNSENY